jgi:hypothetical protein
MKCFNDNLILNNYNKEDDIYYLHEKKIQILKECVGDNYFDDHVIYKNKIIFYTKNSVTTIDNITSTATATATYNITATATDNITATAIDNITATDTYNITAITASTDDNESKVEVIKLDINKENIRLYSNKYLRYPINRQSIKENIQDPNIKETIQNQIIRKPIIYNNQLKQTIKNQIKQRVPTQFIKVPIQNPIIRKPIIYNKSKQFMKNKIIIQPTNLVNNENSNNKKYNLRNIILQKSKLK